HGDLAVLLLEDHLALLVGDHRRALLPLHLVEGVDPGGGEAALDDEPPAELDVTPGGGGGAAAATGGAGGLGLVRCWSGEWDGTIHDWPSLVGSSRSEHGGGFPQVTHR